ncbi:MAG: hypothetical protein K9N21_01965 [Deltaproteobacteria bacterium]|nr:hypothetical protein [Deltaproteobacteria bacterium]
MQIFLLVTEGTLEENLLGTLSAKQALFLAALDPESEATAVDLQTGVEELKNRLEILLGQKPDAAIDESLKEDVEKEAELLARRERISAAGGQLLGAAFSFIGEIFSGKEETEQSIQMAEAFKRRLTECLERGEDGSLKMTVTLPDESALDTLSRSLAQILA